MCVCVCFPSTAKTVFFFLNTLLYQANGDCVHFSAFMVMILKSILACNSTELSDVEIHYVRHNLHTV